MFKLAIISTHPVQYNAPWFKLLTERKQIHPKVFYTWEQSNQGAKYDPGFGKIINWDIPLLEGYEYTFVKNIAKEPGTHHFKGINNPTLISEIEKWRPDAVLIFGWSFISHLKCLRHFSDKIPVLFRGDSTLLDDKGKTKSFLRKIFLTWVYKHIDYALYVGINNKKYFLHYGLKEKQLIHAPHAIDNDRFSGTHDQYNQQVNDYKLKLGITEKDIVVLFSGKLEAKKNPNFLIELAKKIPYKNLKFLLVGNGALESHLKKISIDDKRIIFMDFQNQLLMPVIYRLGDVFILPSTGPGETWGLGANEAMASGCALMLSDKVGGAVDLVKEDENGIVFKTFEIEKCIQFLNKVMSHQILLTKMKQNSRGLVKKFSFDNIVNSIETTCNNLNQMEGIYS